MRPGNAALFVALASTLAACRPPPATGFAALVRAKVTTPEGTVIAQGCEAGSAIDGLSGGSSSLGARAVRVPATKGLRVRLTLRFEDVDKSLPDDMGPDDDDRVFCSAEGVTARKSRPLALGCVQTLRVTGADAPGEIRAITPLVEGQGEVGLVADVVVHHTGVLVVRPSAPCPSRDEFEILTIGDPRPKTAVIAR